MFDRFYEMMLSASAVLGFFVLLTLAFSLWWLWQGLRRHRAGSGSLAPVAVAAVMAAGAVIAGALLALYAFLGLPMMIEAFERHTAGSEEQQAMIDRPAPRLAFTGVADDREHTLDEFAGRVVLVNLWGTWCGPCRREMPALERLQRELGPRGLTVIHLSEEPRAELTDYLERKRPANLHVYAESMQWPAFALPTTYLVDREGIVREFRVGGASYKAFAEMVEPYLSGAPPAGPTKLRTSAG